MKKRYQSVLLTILILHFFPAIATEFCKTDEVCIMGKTCRCIVGANSAYRRSFYFELTEVHNKNIYRCVLNSLPNRFYMSSYKFPENTAIKCDTCQQFPINFTLDTHGMVETTGQGKIKYLVFTSDIPDTVTISCKIINNKVST